jgi:hypothetical protein
MWVLSVMDIEKSFRSEHRGDVSSTNIVVGIEAYNKKVPCLYPELQLFFEVFDESTAEIAIVLECAEASFLL